MISQGKAYKLLARLNLLTETEIEIKRQDEFEIIRDSIKEHIRKAYEKNSQIYNLRSRIKDFVIGQTVIRRNFAQSFKIGNFNAKLAPVGVNSKVLRKIEQVNYELEDLEGGSKGVYYAKEI